jgi:chromosome segregation ATPase
MTFTARIKIVGPTGSSLNYDGPVTVEQKDCIVSALHGETDIATLEQEARQMRARMERLECENTQLTGLIESLRAELRQENCLSFRNQVAELEVQRDELLEFMREIETVAPQTKDLWIHTVKVKAAAFIASAKGGAA